MLQKSGSARLEQGFIKEPLKQFKTGGAKFGVFTIRILNPGRGVHHTASIPAMGHSECVTELVQSRLFHPSQQKIRIGWLVIKLGPKPVQGYY